MVLNVVSEEDLYIWLVLIPILIPLKRGLLSLALNLPASYFRPIIFLGGRGTDYLTFLKCMLHIVHG